MDMNFRYYVFTKNFLYAGQYVGKKAGLGPDYSKTHTGILGDLSPELPLRRRQRKTAGGR